MAFNPLLATFAQAAGQQPGALDVSPAVSAWMSRIKAAQAGPAVAQAPIDGQYRVVDSAPSATDAGQPSSARTRFSGMPATVPGMPDKLHPVRNAILGLLGGGLGGMAAQIAGNEQRKIALERMQSVYSALPDEYKPLFAADPQGFLASYMKNVEPQKLGKGEMAIFGGPTGTRILNAERLIDDKSGKPVYLNEDGPQVFDSLGGDIKADNGLIVSGREGVKGTYSTPQKLQMGESPGAFTPSVSGLVPGEQGVTQSSRPIIPAAAAKNMVGFKAPTGEVADMVRSRAAAAGLDEGDQANLVRIGQLESSLNPNPRQNGSSTGLFQFHPDIFARMGGKDISDPVQQTDAAIRLYKNNRDALSAAGLPVTPTSLYLSHQQGIVGARALYEAYPGAKAVDAIAPIYAGQYGQQKGMRLARQAIVNNGGSDQMTVGDFLSKWQGKVEGAATSASDAGQPAAAQIQGAPGWSLGAPGGMAGVSPEVANLSGDALIKALPPMVANQVRALAEGRVPAQGFALSKPYWQQVMQLAEQYEPGFDASVFQQRVQARKSVAPGGSVSNNLVALSTAQQHIGKLWKAIGDLHNAGFPLFDKVGNSASEAAGQPNVTNFKVTRDAVTDELERALRGSGGSITEIMEWRKRLQDSNSPDQLYGTASQMSELLYARMAEAMRPYNEVMGTNLQPEDKMTPAARDALNMIHSGSDWKSWQSGKGRASSPQSSSIQEGSVAVGPNGHQIVLKGGHWIDPQTGAVVR
jgi:hypothetical protein